MSYLPQGQAEEALGDLGVLDPRGLNGWFDSVKKIGTGVAKGALDVYGEAQRQRGAAEAYKAQLEAQAAAEAVRKSMPGWVIPAVVGGGALVLLLLLKK